MHFPVLKWKLINLLNSPSFFNSGYSDTVFVYPDYKLIVSYLLYIKR